MLCHRRREQAHNRVHCAYSNMHNSKVYRVAQKSKPLPDDQKIVLNRIEACQWD